MTTSIIVLLALVTIVLIGILRFTNKENRKEQTAKDEEINSLVDDAVEASRIKIELENSIAVLEKILAKREKIIENKVKDIDALSLTNSSLQDNIQYQEGRIATKEAELDKAKDTITSLDEDAIQYRKMIEDNAVSISALNDTVAFKDESLNECRLEVIEQKRLKKNLQEKIRRDAKNYETRLTLVTEMRRTMNELAQELDKKVSECHDLKIKLNALELKIHRMPPRKKDRKREGQ